MPTRRHRDARAHVGDRARCTHPRERRAAELFGRGALASVARAARLAPLVASPSGLRLHRAAARPDEGLAKMVGGRLCVDALAPRPMRLAALAALTAVLGAIASDGKATPRSAWNELPLAISTMRAGCALALAAAEAREDARLFEVAVGALRSCNSHNRPWQRRGGAGGGRGHRLLLPSPRSTAQLARVEPVLPARVRLSPHVCVCVGPGDQVIIKSVGYSVHCNRSIYD